MPEGREGRGGRKLEWKKGKGEEENTKGKREGVRKGRKEMDNSALVDETDVH